MGHPETLSRDPHWKSWLEWALQKGLWTDSFQGGTNLLSLLYMFLNFRRKIEKKYCAESKSRQENFARNF